jgi:mRNA interferase RelE/StbE
MKVEFDRSFLKSLDKINDSKVLRKIESIILSCEEASQVSQIPNIKKLIGFSNYYRIRSGSYRIGIELINDSVLKFIVVSHRKDIYKKFP